MTDKADIIVWEKNTETNEVQKEKYESYRYEWYGNDSKRVPYQATRTTIHSIDND